MTRLPPTKYEVRVVNLQEHSSATRREEHCHIAVYEAVKHSAAVTIKSLLVGLAATALMEGDIDADDADALRRWLRSTDIPMNARDTVQLLFECESQEGEP